MNSTRCDAALHTLKQRRYRQLSRAVVAAFLFFVAPLARAQGKPNAGCPLEEALDFQVVQALKVLGVTDQQFEALAAAGEIRREMSAVCLNELNDAIANPDTNCQIVNGDAISRLSSYVAVAGYLFRVTGDTPTLRVNIRRILRNYLESVPHKCWFQGAKIPPPPPPPPPNSPVVSDKRLTPAQCAQLRDYYQACKQQADQAQRKCMVTPAPSNCAYTLPTCMLPPC